MPKNASFKALLGWLARVSAILVLAGCAQSLYAQTFDFSFSGPGISASGVFDTTFVSGDEYLVTSISGTQNGNTMVLLPPGGYASNDNLIFSTPPYLDLPGVSFDFLVGTTMYNVYYDAGLSEYIECNSVTDGACFAPSGVALTSFTLTQTPESGTMLLFGTGLLMIAGVLRRTMFG
jgi:hypothetical protein